MASALAARTASRSEQSASQTPSFVSVVFVTVNVVGGGGARIRLAILGAARGGVKCWLAELEAALGVNLRVAPPKTTSVNSDQITILFNVMLPRN